MNVPKVIDMPMRFKGKDIKVHIHIYGSLGKQLLCLHGFGSTGKDSFGKVANYLSDGYQLVTIDWIGFGNTTRLLRKKDTYNHKYFASFMEKFVKVAVAKKILRNKFSIFAVSMSGLMTGMVYKKIEKHLESIIFLNPAGFDKTVSMKYSMVLANPLLNKEAFLKIIAKDIFWKKFLGLKEKHKKEMFRRFNNKEFDVYTRCVGCSVNMAGYVKETHVYKKYHEIRVPVLLITCLKDTLMTEQEYLKTAEKYKWKIIKIKHYSHLLTEDKPKEVAKAVKSFL